jgi:cysteine desulfurase
MPDGDRKLQWVIRLDKAGFAVSTGSACTTGTEEPSHVLAAMGLKAAQAARAVRFSAGWETNESDWETLVKGVAKVHAEMHHGKAHAAA